MALELSVIRTWRYVRSYVGSAVSARCSSCRLTLKTDLSVAAVAEAAAAAKAGEGVGVAEMPRRQRECGSGCCPYKRCGRSYRRRSDKR